MDAPIVDFVRKYANTNKIRFHMPGHKGKSFLGFENFDITEIDGADELFAPEGIIEQSLANASSVFGCPTFYSAEGSTLCIHAMVYLIASYARSLSRQPLILAARNAHRSFVNAAALTSTDIIWVYPSSDSSYYSGVLSAIEIERAIIKCERKPDAFYITSPDYLGNIADIRSISAVCRKHGVLLVVDNAHGAYLKFLPESMHPIDLGADICCDSAHKTLPVITGGAYLHISKKSTSFFIENANKALALFASSSPSYLILQSLDNFNRIHDEYGKSLKSFIPAVYKLKNECISYGYKVISSENVKLAVSAENIGYTGEGLALNAINSEIVPEYYDRDYVVFMLSPYNGFESVRRAEEFFLSQKKKSPVKTGRPETPRPAVKMKPSEVIYALSEILPVDECEGRVCAYSVVGCPPAVPVVVYGEEIDRKVIECLKYYGNKTCCVIKE